LYDSSRRQMRERMDNNLPVPQAPPIAADELAVRHIFEKTYCLIRELRVGGLLNK